MLGPVDADVANELVWAFVRGHGRWTRGARASETLAELFAKHGGMVGALHSDWCEMAKSIGRKACTCSPFLVRSPAAVDG